jgi:hypothetical protein
MKIHLVGVELFRPDGHTDGQMDGQTTHYEANNRLSQFFQAPEKDQCAYGPNNSYD